MGALGLEPRTSANETDILPFKLYSLSLFYFFILFFFSFNSLSLYIKFNFFFMSFFRTFLLLFLFLFFYLLLSSSYFFFITFIFFRLSTHFLHHLFLPFISITSLHLLSLTTNKQTILFFLFFIILLYYSFISSFCLIYSFVYIIYTHPPPYFSSSILWDREGVFSLYRRWEIFFMSFYRAFLLLFFIFKKTSKNIHKIASFIP